MEKAPNIVRVIKSRIMRLTRHVVCTEERRGAYKVVVGKPKKKRPLERPKRRWEGNIKMDLQEVGCGTWTELIWLRIGTGGGHLQMQ
jgi:hypothetical protein